MGITHKMRIVFRKENEELHRFRRINEINQAQNQVSLIGNCRCHVISQRCEQSNMMENPTEN